MAKSLSPTSFGKPYLSFRGGVDQLNTSQKCEAFLFNPSLVLSPTSKWEAALSGELISLSVTTLTRDRFHRNVELFCLQPTFRHRHSEEVYLSIDKVRPKNLSVQRSQNTFNQPYGLIVIKSVEAFNVFPD